MRAASLALAFLFAATEGVASESVTSRAGVATSSRFATQAAINTLREGGTAMDAATAAAFVLAVARPDAAGIGGGGFLVYYDKTEDATWSVDFRETATWSLVRPESEPPVPDGLAAVGTPGVVAGLRTAHERFGRSEWRDLVRPAILLAQEGYDVDGALTSAFATALAENSLDQTAHAVLFGDAPKGMAPQRIVQPDLAQTLTRIARAADDFYTGTTATRIAEFAKSSVPTLTIRDLREYIPVWRAPLLIDLGEYKIQTAPPPARGGVTIASMLAILGDYDLAAADLASPGTNHLLVETQRRATFDAKRVVADPSYSRIAIASVLTAERAEFWRSTIKPGRVTSTPMIVDRSSSPGDHTTHISIVDGDGNLASLTLSLSGNFGSGIMVPGTGVLLNAALRDFARSASSSHANAPEPRKRPGSPVAPMIVFSKGKPFLAAGSSGGDAIAACLTRLIIHVTRKSESLSAAIAAPRIHQPDYPDRVVFEPELSDTARRLEAMGHNTQEAHSIGEINAVMITGDKIVSVSDPRGKGSTGGF